MTEGTCANSSTGDFAVEPDAVPNESLVCTGSSIGFDTRVTFVDRCTNKSIFVYTQMLLGNHTSPTSSSSSTASDYAKTIVNILLHHYLIHESRFALTNVFIVFIVCMG